MKIVSITGARPQFIKYSALGREIRKTHQDILIHTGQHYDYKMNKVFFDEMGIPEPDYNLGIGSGSHAFQTGEMLKGIEEILLKEQPDLVMVYGDTNSTLAGALAAAKLHIKVAHVEAGLRSFDRSMPEEINRVLTDHCSDLLFCPTQTAVDNLKNEGITRGVHLTGDVMVDALRYNRQLAARSNILEKLNVNSKQYLLVTLHRASNTDIEVNLKTITDALLELARQGETIVFPLHPRTKKQLEKFALYEKLNSAARLIEPLGYFDFLNLLDNAKTVLTDSGGIQKEAYILKVPCITLRENTEWVETIQDGWNVLAGCDKESILEFVRENKVPLDQKNVFGLQACRTISILFLSGI